VADDVEVKISADDTGLESGLNKAKDSTRKFADEVEKQAERTSKAWAEASNKVGKTLLAFSAVGAAGFVAASREALGFESSMRRVNTIAKLSETGLKDLSGQVQKMGDRMKTTKNVSEMSSALYQVYSSGLQGAKAMQVLEAAVQAADAGMTDTKTAADVLTTAMISYRLPAEKASYVSDLLFKTVDKGKVTFEQLAHSIGPVLTVASKFGVSMEEVSAAMAQLSLTAASPEEAATALERTITQLAAPTEETRKKLDALGASYGTNALKAKGLVGVLKEWRQVAGDSETDFRKMLSSSEALKAGLELTADGGKEATKFLEDMGHAAGAAADANTEMAKDTGFAFQVFQKNLANLGVKIGAGFLPIAKTLVDSLSGVADKFNAMDEEQRNLVSGAGLAATAIGGITGALFLLAPQIASLPKAIGVARLAAVGFAGSLTGTVVAALGATALAAGALYVAWEKNFLGMRQVTEDAAEAIRQALIGLKLPGFEVTENDDAQRIRDRKKLISQNRIPGGRPGLQVQFTGSTPGLSARDVLPQRGALASSAPAASTALNPQVKALLEQTGSAPANRAAAAAATKKRKATEEELRLAMVAQAKALVGLPTADVRKAMGGLGKESEQCANTIRLIGEKAKMPFGFDGKPWDSSLLGPGEGVGKAHADSLFGSKVGKFFKDKKQARPGDLAFYDDATRPGVVQHVEMVDDRGGTIGASSSQGRVSQRQGLGDLGSRRLIGFVSPNMFGGKAGAGMGDDSEYLEILKDRRKKFLEFVESDIDKGAAALYEKYQEALAGAGSEKERGAITSSYQKQKTELLGANYEQATGLDAAMGSPQTAQEMADQIIEIQRQAYEMRKELGMADTQARIEEIQQVLQLEGIATTTKTDLLREQSQLKEEQRQTDIDNADQRLQRQLEDIEFERQMGELTLEEKLQRLNIENQAFQGSIEKKRGLLLEIHNTETALQTERWALADQVFNSFEQGLQGMLTQTLSSQQSFSQTFTSLWKSVANQVLAEVTKMIVKALLLQKIMRGIFSFFGGIFGGAASIITPALDLGGGLGIAHSGGMVIPGGIASFHTGGMVGAAGFQLQPDEVLAKLQVGEMVLSRDHVGALRSSEGAAQPIQLTNHIYANLSNQIDVDRLGGQLGMAMKRRLQEQA